MSERMGTFKLATVLLCLFMQSSNSIANDLQHPSYILEAGHSSLAVWKLPQKPPAPEHNKTNPERVKLGERLFFDQRLSGDNSMSCATCHNPALGWSDGLPKSIGFNQQMLDRASPSIINSGYNSIFMWDGRFPTLEAQALGPIESPVEMNKNIDDLVKLLKSDKEYSALFQTAYPNEPLSPSTIGKALASFERTIVSNNSPFDRWVDGEASAMTELEVKGFEVFLDTNKGNCAACHHPPNFTDDGFHNLGLEDNDNLSKDLGRFNIKPVGLMKSAFKTPTLRDVDLNAPYFHDGSASNLEQVMDHYIAAGKMNNVSPNLKHLNLSELDKSALMAFLKALTSKTKENNLVPQASLNLTKP